MKTTHRGPTLSRRRLNAFLAGFLFALAGCDPGVPPPPPASSARSTDQVVPPAAVVSAEKTSFREVTAHLDAGGGLYVYASTEKWLRDLSRTVEGWRDALLATPGMSDSDRANLRTVFNVLARLAKHSGIEGISGVGGSGIALEAGYYRTKIMIHHYPGQDAGYLWTLFGEKAHALDGFDWLPADTAGAWFFDLDLTALWQALRAETADIPPAAAALDQVAAATKQASSKSIEELLDSLTGQHGAFLTLSETERVSVPLPSGQTLDIPQPRLALAFKVKDEILFQWLCQFVDEKVAPNLEVAKIDEPDLQMRAVAVPAPVPIELRPTLARVGDYLVLATTDTLPRQMLDIHAGRRPGLKSSAEYVKLAEGLPREGNSAVFVSRRLGAAVQAVQAKILEQAAQQAGDAPIGLLQKLISPENLGYGMSVDARVSEGWLTVSHGNQDPASALLLPIVVVPTAILAGIAMPAFTKARTQAQSIQCINNLKQLGLAAHIYAVDHEDRFPPEIAALKNELALPRVLFCPQDPQAPNLDTLSWESLDESRVSYEYLTPGKRDAELKPDEVMFRCRIHGHTCRADGSVRRAD